MQNPFRPWDGPLSEIGESQPNICNLCHMRPDWPEYCRAAACPFFRTAENLRQNYLDIIARESRLEKEFHQKFLAVVGFDFADSYKEGTYIKYPLIYRLNSYQRRRARKPWLYEGRK